MEWKLRTQILWIIKAYYMLFSIRVREKIYLLKLNIILDYKFRFSNYKKI